MTGGVAGRSPRSSRVGTSLSHALGPQLGSLCFSSAVLTLVSYLRQLLEKARREQGNNLLFCIFAYFANLFYTLIEFCTKFATVQMALTGQAFMPAAHSVVDLLRRNFLDAFGVWNPAFLDLVNPSTLNDPAACPAISHARGLKQVVDAVFLCFALDRDMRTCTRVEVHQVYCCLPTVGPVVEQPDGDVAYGRPPQPATV
ncbi:uncharacterized protein HaLaN_14852, partial [Haematococcus lacustris]